MIEQENKKLMYEESYLKKKFKLPVMAAQAVYMASIIKAHENPIFDLTMTQEQKQAEIDEFNAMLNNPELTYTDEEVSKMEAPENQWDVIAENAAEQGDKELENFAREMNDYDNERLSFMNDVYNQNQNLLKEEIETLEKIDEYDKIKNIAHDSLSSKELEATIISERPIAYMVESMKETLKTIHDSRQMLKENDRQYRTVTEQALENTAKRIKDKSSAIQIAVGNSMAYTAKSINNVGKILAKSFVDFGRNSIAFLNQAKTTTKKVVECVCEVYSLGAYSELKSKNITNMESLSSEEKQEKLNNLKEVHDIVWGIDGKSPYIYAREIHQKAKDAVNEKIQNAVDTVSLFAEAMKEKAVVLGTELTNDVIQKRDAAIEKITNKIDSISMAVAINKTKLEAKALLVEADFVEKTANLFEKIKTHIANKAKRLDDYEQTIYDKMQDMEKERMVLIEQLVPFQKEPYKESAKLQEAKADLAKVESNVCHNLLSNFIEKQMKKELKEHDKQQKKLEIKHDKELAEKEGQIYELNEEFVELIDYKNEILQKLRKENQRLSDITDVTNNIHKKASDLKTQANMMLNEVETPDIEMA